MWVTVEDKDIFYMGSRHMQQSSIFMQLCDALFLSTKEKLFRTFKI